jgi:RNA-binding protein 27
MRLPVPQGHGQPPPSVVLPIPSKYVLVESFFDDGFCLEEPYLF